MSIDRWTCGRPPYIRRSDNDSIADDDVGDDNVNNDDDNNNDDDDDDDEKKNFNSNIIIIVIILTAIVTGTIIFIKNQSNALNMYMAQNYVLFIVNENSTMNNQVGRKREERRRETGRGWGGGGA